MSDDGVIQCTQETLRGLLADCYAWQHWQGLSQTRDQAIERIYHDALPPPHDRDIEYGPRELSAIRPFMILSTETFGGYQLDFDSEIDFAARGTLRVVIEQDRPEDTDNDPGRADREMRVALGHLLRSGDDAQPGLVELVRAGRMRIQRVSISGPQSQPPEETEAYGECQWMQLTIDWEL